MACRLRKRLAQKVKIIGEDEPTGKIDPLDVGDKDALVRYESSKSATKGGSKDGLATRCPACGCKHYLNDGGSDENNVR